MSSSKATLKSTQSQQPLIIPKRVVSCSCCHVQGHNIQTCRSPQVFQFQNDAKLSAKHASCIDDLQKVAPFINASPSLLKVIIIRVKLESGLVSKLQLPCLIKILASYYWRRYNPAGPNYIIGNHCREAQITTQLTTDIKVKEAKRIAKANSITEQDKLRQLAPELVFKTQQIQLLNQSQALAEYEAIRRPREALTVHFVLDIKIKKKAKIEETEL